MKQQCPNCKQFEYERGYSTRNIGCGCMIVLPIIIGGASVYGLGDSAGSLLMLISFLIGLAIVIKSYIKPDQTIEWKCNQCNFSQTHEF
jgi:hypothetical protein|tara:strand:+ start:932 stop:1198 length:267 start_codon:yes stop_codon:yes gene_type:complete